MCANCQVLWPSLKGEENILKEKSFKNCIRRAFLFFLTALYGVLFEKDEEAAFSNYRLWESLGFILAYILQNLVCIDVKLWVVVAVLGAGMGGYLAIEVMEKKKGPRNN